MINKPSLLVKTSMSWIIGELLGTLVLDLENWGKDE
jgi:hypothetical protein